MLKGASTLAFYPVFGKGGQKRSPSDFGASLRAGVNASIDALTFASYDGAKSGAF